MTRETREQIIAKARPKRVSVYDANRDKPTVTGLDQENFMYRWVNDTEGRISMFVDGGWEFVDGTGKQVGDGGVDSTEVRNSALSKGMGGGVVAYLMRIPKELWLEDQARKEKEQNAALEADIRRNADKSADYGRLNINVKGSS
jgi:hypothetical protein